MTVVTKTVELNHPHASHSFHVIDLCYIHKKLVELSQGSGCGVDGRQFVFRFRLRQEIVLFYQSPTATQGAHSASHSSGTDRKGAFSRVYNGRHSPPSSAKVTCTFNGKGRLWLKLQRIS